MSGSFPTSPKIASINISSLQPTLISRTISGRKQARQIGGQLWRMSCNFAPLTRAQFSPILAFIISQRGAYDTFTIAPNVHKDTQGVASGSAIVNGASQTGRTVVTDNWANSSAVMKAGDFIKFGGHSKVYMVTGDVTSDGSGNASISIEPALITSPADNEAVVYNDIPFTVSLDGEIQEFQAGRNGFYTYSMDLIEVF